MYLKVSWIRLFCVLVLLQIGGWGCVKSSEPTELLDQIDVTEKTFAAETTETTLPSPENSKRQVSIRSMGQVVDGPIAWAFVQLRHVSTGEILRDDQGNIITLLTQEDGTYTMEFSLDSSFNGSSFIVESIGGIDTGSNGAADANDLSGIGLKSRVTLTWDENAEENEITFSNQVLSPLTTLTAAKMETYPGLSLANLTQALAGQIGIAQEDVLANPLENANAAQVGQALGLIGRIVETVSSIDSIDSMSALEAIEHLSLHPSSVVTLADNSNGLIIDPQNLSQVLLNNSEFNLNTQNRLKAIVEASATTIAYVAQQSGQQVQGKLDNETGKQNQASVASENGIKGLLSVVDTLTNESIQYHLSQGQLNVMATILTASVEDKMNDVLKQSNQSFEALTPTMIDTQAKDSTLSSGQANSMATLIKPLFGVSNSTLAIASNAYESNTLTEGSVFGLKLEAFSTAIAAYTQTFMDSNPAIDLTGTAYSEFQESLQVTDQILDFLINSTFVSQLQTSLVQLKSTDREIVLDSALLATVNNAIVFVQQSIQNNHLDQLKQDLSNGTGTLLSNVLNISKHAGETVSTVLTNILQNDSTFLQNSFNQDLVVDDIDLVTQLVENSTSDIFSDSLTTSVIEAAGENLQTSVLDKINSGEVGNAAPPTSVQLTQAVSGVSLGALSIRISGGSNVDYATYTTTTSVQANSVEKSFVKKEVITQVAFPDGNGIVLSFDGIQFDTVDRFDQLFFSTALPLGAVVEVYDGLSLIATNL